MPTFSANLERSLHQALAIAGSHDHEFATLEHLLLALLDDPDVLEVLEGCHVSVPLLQKNLENYISTDLDRLLYRAKAECRPTVGFQRVIQRAVIHVQTSGNDEVTGANVLVSFFAERDSQAVFFLQEQNMSRYDAVSYISHGIVKNQNASEDPLESPLQEERAAPQVGGKREGLDLYCTNLNQKALEGKIDPLIGRAEELRRAIQILCRRRKNNPIFVGDPGVGKTAIAEGLALQIVQKKVPEVLEKTVLFSLNMGALLAGTRYRGDFEERLVRVIKAVEEHPSAIIFIDEIHTVIGAGATSSGSMDASNLLKPALASGEFRCIGSTTYKEFREHFERDQAFLRRFQKISVEEPSHNETLKILKGVKTALESHHGVRYTSEALRLAVVLSDRHLHERKLPDKAIDVLDESAASQALLSPEQRSKTIGSKEVESTIASMARIPPRTVSRDDRKALAHLDKDLKRVVYGQDKAVEELVSAVITSRAGLRDETKPIGNYLFSGPTGVGKTELACQLAKRLGMELVRFDMSEYMERHTVSRLIGAPPGYVGFDQGGLLTDRVDQKPNCVLLLDEIEKAHPDLFNILLQMMDHGCLTDHNGKKVSFRNVIIIMTTNAGAADLEREPVGFSRLSRQGDDQEAIKRLFTPEFRNRLDAIIPFGALSPSVIHQVVLKFIMQLEAQLVERNVTFELSEKALEWLAQKGYDRQMGARHLARFIQEKIKKPLATEMLFGKLRKGGLVRIGVSAAPSDHLIFHFEKEGPVPDKKAALGKKKTSKGKGIFNVC